MKNRNNRGMRSPTRVIAVTPSDASDLAEVAEYLYVGGAGNLSVIMAGDTTNGGAGTAVTILGVAAGATLWGAFKRVRSTNTTCTNITAFC